MVALSTVQFSGMAAVALSENMSLILLPNYSVHLHVLVWKTKYHLALIYIYWMVDMCHALVLISVNMHVFLSKPRRNWSGVQIVCVGYSHIIFIFSISSMHAVRPCQS